jgi:excisionase family DNA binding protein
MEEERWYSVEEIAAHLGVVKETVYRWIEGKGLPAHKIGKFWKFKVSEVDTWARQGSSGGGQSGGKGR